jgi:orotidine-5'-phosphate decarboxylase
VVGATAPDAVADVRRRAPSAPLLLPGVGAQGGDLEAAVRAGLDARGGGAVVPVSRAISAAADPRLAARELRDRIAAVRAAA